LLLFLVEHSVRCGIAESYLIHAVGIVGTLSSLEYMGDYSGNFCDFDAANRTLGVAFCYPLHNALFVR
jgi:hypothetical protein